MLLELSYFFHNASKALQGNLSFYLWYFQSKMTSLCQTGRQSGLAKRERESETTLHFRTLYWSLASQALLSQHCGSVPLLGRKAVLLVGHSSSLSRITLPRITENGLSSSCLYGQKIKRRDAGQPGLNALLGTKPITAWDCLENPSWGFPLHTKDLLGSAKHLYFRLDSFIECSQISQRPGEYMGRC